MYIHKYLVFSLLLFFILLILGVFYGFYKTPKTAYVNTSEVYNKFKLKKKLISKWKNVKNKRQSKLDSIKLKLQGMSRRLTSKDKVTEIEKEKFAMKRDQFLEKQRQFDKANQKLKGKYNEQIWTQLNQYIQDYADMHEYTYIYGATGNGSLMAADKAYDITEQIIEFANNKYADKSN